MEETYFSELHFGVSRAQGTGGGGGSPLASFDDVRLIVPANSPRIPQLMRYVANGASIQEATILVQEYPLLKLKYILVTSLTYLNPSQFTPAQCEITLNYREIEFKWEESGIHWNVQENSGDICQPSELSFVDTSEYTGSETFDESIPISWIGFSVSQPTSIFSGAGGGGSRTSFADIELVMELTIESPCFFSLVASGGQISRVRIDKYVGDDERVLAIGLENVMISNYQLFPTSTGYPAVKLAINFEKIALSHYEGINATDFQWDVKNNSEY